jgi:hypothetical protein
MTSVDLNTALKALNAKEPNYRRVIDEALYHARENCIGRLNQHPTPAKGDPFLTTVEYNKVLDCPVAILRDFDDDGKLKVVAAYTMQANDCSFDFAEVTGGLFADIASKDYIAARLNASREPSNADREMAFGDAEYARDLMKMSMDGKRQEIASGYFQQTLNEMNIALICDGYEPFRNWREFWAAALQGASAVGDDVKSGVSWQDYRALTGGWEPETRELQARLGYRDDGSEIKPAW